MIVNSIWRPVLIDRIPGFAFEKQDDVFQTLVFTKHFIALSLDVIGQSSFDTDRQQFELGTCVPKSAQSIRDNVSAVFEFNSRNVGPWC